MLVALLALALLASACLVETDPSRYVDGRTIRVGVTQLRKISEMHYQDASDLKHYALKPKDPERNTLAIAQVTIANYQSARVLLFVDTPAAYVDDNQNQRFIVKDPFKERVEIPAAGKDENVYGRLPLWGTVTLDKNMQVTGFMVFEIPKESGILRFGWSQGESIVVRFCDKGC